MNKQLHSFCVDVTLTGAFGPITVVRGSDVGELVGLSLSPVFGTILPGTTFGVLQYRFGGNGWESSVVTLKYGYFDSFSPLAWDGDLVLGPSGLVCAVIWSSIVAVLKFAGCIQRVD